MVSRATCLLLLACAAAGCNGEDGAETTGEPPGCAPGEYLRSDGVCAAPGLPPDMLCPPGEWPRESDGACLPAGVPPDGCGTGFSHDGDRGCEPVLPAAPCPGGLMAVPGEASCREVAPCGATPWGDIPVEPTTEHVDASYTGGMSDGSPAAPWTTVQAGVDAAAPGAIVAVAAGAYLEDVVVQAKPVRLWGRCPALVELRGTGAALAALFVRVGASATEVHRLAISGLALGLIVSGSENVLVEEAWIHDNADRGVEATTAYGPTSITVKRSLLENNHEIGVFALGAELTVEATAVRDTLPDALGGGRGINVQDDASGASIATLRGSLLEKNHELGMIVIGVGATVEATVIRDTLPDGQSVYGKGLGVEDSLTTGSRANVSVRSSLLEGNQGVGVAVVSSDATLEATVVRDTLPNAQGGGGRGITAEDDPTTNARASIIVVGSLLERNQEVGVYVYGSDATLQASAVRDTLPSAQGLFGRGVSVEDSPQSGARSSLAMRGSLVERNLDLGVLVGGSDAIIEATITRDTGPNTESLGGRGIQVQDHPETGAVASATMRACLLEGNLEAALEVVGAAAAQIEACSLLDTAAQGGALGDGLVVWSAGGAASATVTSTRIERSARAAMSSFGAAVTLESTHLVCQAFDLAAESWEGLGAAYQDLGGVRCGCTEATEPCHAQSYALTPPPRL